jgi:signal peptidase
VFAVVTLLATVGPKVLPYRTYAVMSASMVPAIPVGALTVEQRVDPYQLRVGDVISFQEPGRSNRTITHRVSAIHEAAAGFRLTTKGDANNSVDGWPVQTRDPLWRVSFAVPLLGYIFGSMTMPAGRAVFVLLPAAVLILLLLYEVLKPGMAAQRP